MNDQEELKVNDGGGLMDAEGLIDTLIIDCNEIPKSLCSGMYIQFCAKMVEMVQKLSALKEGVTGSFKINDERIQELRAQNDELRQRIIEYQEKEGAK